MNISIIGCGWLGLPLAELLIYKEHVVKGSTTHREKLDLLSSKNIRPFLINLNPDETIGNINGFFESDILIINIPPGRKDDIVTFHPAQINFLIDQINNSRIKKVLYISSTSVYGNENKILTEEDETNPETDSGKALFISENLLKKEDGFETTIVRFGGLIGKDRNPAKYFAGRKNISGGDIPVNLIYLDDCLEIIYQIIDKNIWGTAFNACADEHPARSEFYTLAAGKLNLEKPMFIKGEKNSFKIINSNKLKNTLDYKFKFPDPMKFFD